jgi:hypothetical protein
VPLSHLILLLAACARPPAAPPGTEAAAEPSAAVPADAAKAAEEAAAAAAAEAAEARHARETRDVAEVTRLLGVARKDPRGAVDGLLAVDNDWARAWAAFLLVAVLDEPARAAALHDVIYGREAPGEPPTPQDALSLTRIIGDDLPDTSDVPCWIAERWPAEWADAFDPYHGSSKDIFAPLCEPPVDLTWWGVHHDAADLVLGPVTGHCGTLRFAELRSGQMEVFRAWYVPRLLLDPAEAVERHGYREAAIADLLARVDGDRTKVDRFLAEIRPYPPAWRRRLEPRLRAAGLSKAERTLVLDRVTNTLEANSISAVLRCDRHPHEE